jgi:PAS domain S-box-containing protein
MMKQSLRILFAEDNLSDYELACLELKKNEIAFCSQRVETESDFKTSLRTFVPDLVISDYHMPEFSATRALSITLAQSPLLPVLILTSSTGEEAAVQCMKAGATDYILKENITRLPYAIKEALKLKEALRQKEDVIAQLIESESRYKSLFQSNKAVMMLMDPNNGVIVDVNNAASAFYGWSKEAFIGKKITEITTLPDQDVYEKMQLSLTEKQNKFDIQHKLADGSVRDVELYSGPIYQKGKQLLYTIAYDVTEKKTAEHEIRKLIKVIEQSPLSIVITDTRGIIDYVNPFTEELTGYTKAELVGQHTRIFKSGQTPPHVYKELWTTITSGKEWQGRLLNKKKNGELYWDSAFIAPITNSEGVATNYVAIKENITDRIRMDSLEREIEVSRETAQFKQRFMANMSHEIRTPLTGIDGMTQILAATALTNEQKDYLETISISIKSLKEIVNQILDYSKIEAGKLKLTPFVFETKSLITKAKKLFQSLTNGERELLLETEAELPELLMADENRIFQIITNFISNAVKYGGAKVKLNLSFEGRTSDEQMLFKVRVTDNGPGIPVELQNHLFDPFFMLNDASYKMIEGTGLGLAISKDLAEMLGGSIGVTGKPGTQTCFWFTFRAKPAKTMAFNEKKTQLKLITDKQLHILLVDDKVVNQKVVTLMLKAMGHTVEVAGNGQDALDHYLPGKFDLILMDIQMPVMDGISATQEFRKKYKELPPIVGLSASAFEGDREKFMAKGMNDYLTKPLQKDDLIRIVNKFFK